MTLSDWGPRVDRRACILAWPSDWGPHVDRRACILAIAKQALVI